MSNIFIPKNIDQRIIEKQKNDKEFNKINRKRCRSLAKEYTKKWQENTSVYELGTVDLQNVKIDSLYNLERIEGNLALNKYVKSLGKLNTVVGFIYLLHNKNITTLENITTCSGVLTPQNSNLIDLNKLKGHCDWIECKNQNFENLGNVESSSYCNISNTLIKDLGNLKKVYRIYVQNTQIKSVGELIKIAYGGSFRGTEIQNLGKILSIGGVNFKSSTDLRDTYIEQLREDKGKITIHGKLDLRNTPIKTLEGLERSETLKIYVSSDTTLDVNKYKNNFYIKILEHNYNF